MGKKKRKKRSRSSKEAEFSNNPFSKLAKKRKKMRKAAPAPPPPPPEPEPAPDPLRGEELFEAAMEDLGGVDVFQRKFGGGAGEPASSTEASEGSAEPRPSADDVDPDLLDPRLRSAAELFESEMSMAGVERLDADEERRLHIEPARPSLSRDNIPTPEPASSVRLNGAERRLLNQARRHERREGALPQLSLRGMTREPALDALEGFLKTTCVGATFARVIPGKGKQSAEAPVLKFLCAEAFERSERVSEFAPEVNRDGDFGAYVIRLRGRS